VIPGGADTTNGGAQTALVHLLVTNEADVLVQVSLTILDTVPPLGTTLASPAITLTYMIGQGASQPTASKSVTITSTDTAWDNYTATAGNPAYSSTTLTVTPTNGKAMSGAGNNDTVVFALPAAFVPTVASSIVYPVLLHVNAQTPDLRILVTVAVVQQPITASPASVSLMYTKSGSSTTTGPVTLSVLSGMASIGYTITTSSIPVWLTVAPSAAGTANSAGVPIAFTVNANAASGMATGNYSATVLIVPTGYTANPLSIPVALTISNNLPSLSIKEATGVTGSIVNIWGPGQLIPIPTWTALSSDEPIPFTAACVVVASDSTYAQNANTCVLSATAGVAYTWGDQISAALDNTTGTGLFASTLGNSFTVKVTLTPQGGQADGPVSLTYQYNLQPVAPTAGPISPTQAAHIPKGTSLVVTLTGTGFVGPGNLKPGSLEQTQVWLNNATGIANALSASSYVVVSATELMVTIPEVDFPAFPSGKTTVLLPIGVANWTGANQPTQPSTNASWNLTITTSPVVYGITSTASYVQPAPGGSPGLAPYELISIFGDNFGPTGTAIATETLDPYNRVPTSLATGSSGGKPVNLTVTFASKGSGTKSTNYSAPILFANENQINAIVPSGLTAGYPATVTVTDGTLSSDGVFVVNLVTANPGIFTLASDGTGQGAILNQDTTVNQGGNGEKVGNIISIYMTGLGAPDSTAYDMTGNAMTFPTGCVAVSYPTKGSSPGYLEVMNSKSTGYTVPAPPWTSIDGAVIEYSTTLPLKTEIVSGLAPCMTDAVTVVFGPAGNQVTNIETGDLTGVSWAGFVSGAVAGLYQVNVAIPPGTPSGTIPVYVTITNTASGITYTSPPVQMVVK
jgi:uncharacterized protein (TIGR03437 family)